MPDNFYSQFYMGNDLVYSCLNFLIYGKMKDFDLCSQTFKANISRKYQYIICLNCQQWEIVKEKCHVLFFGSIFHRQQC